LLFRAASMTALHVDELVGVSSKEGRTRSIP
jgi:hypothetical protein